MNLIDTNGVDLVLTSGVALKAIYFLAPDVVEEVEMTKLIHKKRLPDNLVPIEDLKQFKSTEYLRQYKRMLNKHSGRSFYNMTGFGDISILATLHVVSKLIVDTSQGSLFGETDSIAVFTRDDELIDKINSEFKAGVSVHPIEQVK